MAYLWNVFSGLSHLLNAILGGDPRVSFSARTGAALVRGAAWAKPTAAVIDGLLFSRNHCLKHAREEDLI